MNHQLSKTISFPKKCNNYKQQGCRSERIKDKLTMYTILFRQILVPSRI